MSRPKRPRCNGMPALLNIRPHLIVRESMIRLARSFAVLAALFLTFGCNKEESSSSSSATPSTSKTASGSSGRPGGKMLVIIPKGTTHVFWQTVNAGAQAAGRERGYEVTFKGPLNENGKAEQ